MMIQKLRTPKNATDLLKTIKLLLEDAGVDVRVSMDTGPDDDGAIGMDAGNGEGDWRIVVAPDVMTKA